MEFERYFFPLKKIELGVKTNKVIGVLKVIKNGARLSMFVCCENLNELKVIEIFNNGEIIEKTEILPEILLSFSAKSVCFGAVIYNKENYPICFSGKNVEINKDNLDEEEQLEKLIDSYFNETKKILRQDRLKKVLFKPLARKKELRYYKSIENNLKNVLYNFPREMVLESMFKTSRWAKCEINNKVVVVGVVFKNKNPYKIGVGFPSAQHKNDVLKRKCGELRFYRVTKTQPLGYYLNFKDATTGLDCFD